MRTFPSLLRGRGLWIWTVAVVAFGLAAACSDTTRPRYIPPAPDTTETPDTTKKQG